MAGAQHERGQTAGEKPLLNFLSHGKEHAAEDPLLPHKLPQFPLLRSGIAASANQNLRGETLLSQVRPHIAYPLVGQRGHVGGRFRHDESDPPAFFPDLLAGGGKEPVAAALPDFDQAVLGKQMESGPDCRPTDLEHLAEPPLAGQKVLPRALRNRGAEGLRRLAGKGQSPGYGEGGGVQTAHAERPLDKVGLVSQPRLSWRRPTIAVPRILDRILRAADTGAELAIFAAPA